MSGATLRVRPFADSDWPAVWAILEPIVRGGEEFGYRVDGTEEYVRHKWVAVPAETFLAEDVDSGEVLGTYYLKPNQDGPGDHVCNCGYATAARARGRGVATRLCEHSQERAVALGFRSMQFNQVVATNEAAVRLWTRLGFAIVGTLPRSFRHPALGLVDAFVMVKELPVDGDAS